MLTCMLRVDGWRANVTGCKLVVLSSVVSAATTATTTMTVHYGWFWEILSQNWGMNFCSCGFIFIIFLNILALKAQKTEDHVQNF